MQVRKYNYLICRVEYPAERGYRMELEKLPDWIHVTITEDKDSKYLTVHSRIHVNKEVRVGPSYSVNFKDMDLLKDLSGQISSIFL
jgi:hypothetical protein